MASLPRGVDGRRRRLRRTFDTRSDAELFLSGLTPEAVVPAEDLTVGDLLGDLQESIRRRFEAGSWLFRRSSCTHCVDVISAQSSVPVSHST